MNGYVLGSLWYRSAAVILEQGDLEGCLEECKKAIEIGRKNYADYPLIAKAYARMGNACFKNKKVGYASQYQPVGSKNVNTGLSISMKMLHHTTSKHSWNIKL